MTGRLEYVSEEGIWVALSEHLEYLNHELSESHKDVQDALRRMDMRDKSSGLGKYKTK